MLDYLKEEEVIEPETTLEEVQKFVEHHIKAEECHDFYAAVRTAAQSSGDDSRKKKKAKA